MLPLVIIEEIRKREERDRSLREPPPFVQVPIPAPAPRPLPPSSDDDEGSSQVVVIDVA